MSKSSATIIEAPAVVEPGPADIFFQRADALFRTAVECCRQHERYARLVDIGALDAEQKAAQQAVCTADATLAEMTAGYEKAASRTHPEGHECWHKANLLWHASREFARRSRSCDLGSRRMGERDDHSTARLGELTLDYDLYASALLALRHATESYKKARPTAV
jgi:hypothetical protein